MSEIIQYFGTNGTPYTLSPHKMSPRTLFTGEYCPPGHNSPVNNAQSSKQPSIKDALQGVQLMLHSSPRWEKLTDAVCYFIAKDGQPLDTVNDKGFSHLLISFEPRYTPPDRKTITNHYLSELYLHEKEKIEKQMEHALYFAVTTDGWTSRANHSYLSLIVHYIDDEWTLQSHLLETHQFAQAHTGDNLASELEGMLETWKLPAIKLSAATTDNAANIVLAMEILGWEHFHCFSHSMQLAINQAFDIPQVSRALARARNLVTHLPTVLCSRLPHAGILHIICYKGFWSSSNRCVPLCLN